MVTFRFPIHKTLNCSQAFNNNSLFVSIGNLCPVKLLSKNEHRHTDEASLYEISSNVWIFYMITGGSRPQKQIQRTHNCWNISIFCISVTGALFCSFVPSRKFRFYVNLRQCYRCTHMNILFEILNRYVGTDLAWSVNWFNKHPCFSPLNDYKLTAQKNNTTGTCLSVCAYPY